MIPGDTVTGRLSKRGTELQGQSKEINHVSAEKMDDDSDCPGEWRKNGCVSIPVDPSGSWLGDSSCPNHGANLWVCFQAFPKTGVV